MCPHESRFTWSLQDDGSTCPRPHEHACIPTHYTLQVQHRPPPLLTRKLGRDTTIFTPNPGGIGTI